MADTCMKQPLLFLLASFLLLSQAGSSQSSPEGAGGYVRIPKGILEGKEVKQFYMSANEITNKQYRDFLQSLRAANDTARLRIATVDTAGWLNILSEKVWTDTYFQDQHYNDFPVVNVTRRGALLYCEWLAEKFKKQGRQNVHITLPTEAQWLYAAQGGKPDAIYPWEGKSLKYEKKGKLHGDYLCNYNVAMDSVRPKIDTAKAYPGATFTATTGSYLPNGYGLYNMSGNVAEMLADKNYTKGGSWHSPAAKVTIAATESYDPFKGSPFVGFRPVMW